MQVMDKDLSAKNIEIRYESKIKVVDPVKRQIQLEDGEMIQYGHAINTARLHADKVAHQFRWGMRYNLLPFKGIY